jgi:integrase
MSVHEYSDKNGNKRYRFQVYLGINPQTGKQQKTRRQGYKTKKAAELAQSRLKLEVENSGQIEKDNNVLFSTVYKDWYQQYINTVRESTYARTKGMFDNHILPLFGNKRIRTITVNQIQNAVNQWFNEVTYNYKRWYEYVVSVFDFAIKQGIITKNPAKLITMPKHPDSYEDKQENFWDKDQLATFFNCIDKDNELEKYTLFRLLAFSGLRRGELLALTWDDLNISQQTLRINKTLTQGMKGKQIVQAPKTKKSRRTIDLDSKTINILKKWRVQQRKEYLMNGINTLSKKQLIFATYKNTHKVLNTPSKWLSKIIKDNGLKKITVHGFRHSHASALFSAGATMKEVQERLGHEDITTTLNIYESVKYLV